MDDLIMYYKKLLQLLYDEFDSISQCLQGELLQAYKATIQKEIETIETQLRVLNDCK